MGLGPIWFGPEERPLFGWLHEPAEPRATAAVLICPPIGHEYHEAYSTLRLLGEKLASQGVVALRLDYDGTGDSAGEMTDPGRVDAWTGSIATGAGLLREKVQAPLIVIGMRLGATMAARAAQQVKPEGLVLWDPVVSGRAYLSEQKALWSLSLGTAAVRAPGIVNLPGLVMSAEAAAQLRAVDLPTDIGQLADRALVLVREQCEPAVLAERFNGPNVEVGEATDQQELMEAGSDYGVIAYAAIERVVGWVKPLAAPAASPIQAAKSSGSAVLTLPGAQGAVVETATTIGPAGLFGIVSQPASGQGHPSAIFVNTANGNHSGVDRAWVGLARRWAALGFRCLRMDLSGLGDSPLRHAAQVRFLSCAPEAFDDIADACRFISPDDPTNVVLVGLCTGGYEVLESALSLRPRAVVAINPEVSFEPPERAAGRALDKRRQIVLPRRALAGKYYRAHYHDGAPGGILHRYINLGRALRRIAAPRNKLALWAREAERRLVNDFSWRARMLADPRRKPKKWLQALLDGGSDVILVTCEQDERPLRVGVNDSTWQALQARGLLALRISDHMLRAPSECEAVWDQVTGHLLGAVRTSGQVGSDAAPGRSAEAIAAWSPSACDDDRGSIVPALTEAHFQQVDPSFPRR